MIVGVVHGAEEGAAVLRGKKLGEARRSASGKNRPLTDLEKATQVTALSNTPMPSTWSVLRLTESQTRT